MSGPAPTVFDGQTKFPKEGNTKLSFEGQYIKYNGRLFRVKITDENGERTLTAADAQQLKWVMRILAQAGFADSNCRMDLNNATISESKVVVSGRTVPLKNDDKVNRLYQKIFPQVLNAGPKVEFVPEDSEEEEAVDSSDNEAAPAAPKAKKAGKSDNLSVRYEVVTGPVGNQLPKEFNFANCTYNQLWDNNRNKISKPYADLETAVLKILEDPANKNAKVIVIPPIVTGNLNTFSSSQIEAIHFYANEAINGAIKKFAAKNPNRKLEIKLQVHENEEIKQRVRVEESATIKGIKVSIVVGDLTRENHGGAIVNAANARLSDGGGVTGAIFERARGGIPGVSKGNREGIDKICRDINSKQGDLKPGEATISAAGAMDPNVQHVIHALGPVFSNPPTQSQYRELENAYYHSLEVAHKNGIKVVTFPTISTGIFSAGLSPTDKEKMYREAAACAMRAIQSFIELTPRVHFADIRLIFMSSMGVEKTKMDLAKAELKKVAD